MIYCKIVESCIVIDCKTTHVYGLDFFKVKDGMELPVKTVEDIFCDLNAAEKLKNLINKGNISELHIDDIVDDYINSL